MRNGMVQKRIIKESCKQLYANKLHNLDEMENFPGRQITKTD